MEEYIIFLFSPYLFYYYLLFIIHLKTLEELPEGISGNISEGIAGKIAEKVLVEISEKNTFL